jgi:hypothetical protein
VPEISAFSLCEAGMWLKISAFSLCGAEKWLKFLPSAYVKLKCG